MRWTDIASIVCGLAIGLFGWIIFAGALLTFGEAEGPMGHVAMTFLLGVVPIVVGFILVWLPFKRRGRRKKEALERSILNLAEASDGRLTPASVAKATELTLDEAKAALDELLLAGHCVSDLQDDGQLVYRF